MNVENVENVAEFAAFQNTPQNDGMMRNAHVQN
jgi:hypothetical protein